MSETTTDNGKTTAIIAHFWIIGLVIAFIMNNDKKDPFAAFYIRQMLGLLLISFAFGLIFYLVSVPVVPMIVNIAMLILWILSLIGAIQGEKKLTPVLGAHFQQWFKGIG